MPRHWRCAHGHTWTGELGALTFCPECGSTDVYEVRRPGQPADGDAPPGQGTFVFDPAAGPDQTYIQTPEAAPGQTFVQPPPVKSGETFIQAFDRSTATTEAPSDITINQPAVGQAAVAQPAPAGSSDSEVD